MIWLLPFKVFGDETANANIHIGLSQHCRLRSALDLIGSIRGLVGRVRTETLCTIETGELRHRVIWKLHISLSAGVLY